MKRLLVIGFLLFLASCSQSNVQSNMLLNGDQEVTVMIGTNYVDLGVVAIEGDSFLEVVVEGQVDTSRLGVYILLYEATDSSGKKLSLTRKVTVISDKEKNDIESEDLLISYDSSIVYRYTIGDKFSPNINLKQGSIETHELVYDLESLKTPGIYEIDVKYSNLYNTKSSNTVTILVHALRQENIYDIDSLTNFKGIEIFDSIFVDSFIFTLFLFRDGLNRSLGMTKFDVNSEEVIWETVVKERIRLIDNLNSNIIMNESKELIITYSDYVDVIANEEILFFSKYDNDGNFLKQRIFDIDSFQSYSLNDSENYVEFLNQDLIKATLKSVNLFNFGIVMFTENNNFLTSVVLNFDFELKHIDFYPIKQNHFFTGFNNIVEENVIKIITTQISRTYSLDGESFFYSRIPYILTFSTKTSRLNFIELSQSNLVERFISNSDDYYLKNVFRPMLGSIIHVLSIENDVFFISSFYDPNKPFSHLERINYINYVDDSEIVYEKSLEDILFELKSSSGLKNLDVKDIFYDSLSNYISIVVDLHDGTLERFNNYVRYNVQISINGELLDYKEIGIASSQSSFDSNKKVKILSDGSILRIQGNRVIFDTMPK